MFLCMTKGLPGSGKTTWAKKHASSNIVIVCRDDIRAMLWPDGKWTGKREKLTVTVQYAAIEAALQAGKSVIVADTNLAPHIEQRLRAVAAEHGADFRVESFLHVSLQQCIERDLKRHDSVGEQVIRRMYMQHLAAPAPAYDDELPDCIIVDVDGTLADNYMVNGKPNRGFFEWSRVGEDRAHQHVVDIVRRYVNADDIVDIIVLTGRDGAAADETARWLLEQGVVADQFYTRAAGDQRKDNVVKRELYSRHVRGKYNVRFVLDDRKQVVDLWHAELGLEVLQVLHPQRHDGF